MKFVEFRATELPAFDHDAITASPPHRLTIERHRVFAGTDKNALRPVGHHYRLFAVLTPNMAGHSGRRFDLAGHGAGHDTCRSVIIVILMKK
jgi:hypothetical protein